MDERIEKCPNCNNDIKVSFPKFPRGLYTAVYSKYYKCKKCKKETEFEYKLECMKEKYIFTLRKRI